MIYLHASSLLSRLMAMARKNGALPIGAALLLFLPLPCQGSTGKFSLLKKPIKKDLSEGQGAKERSPYERELISSRKKKGIKKALQEVYRSYYKEDLPQSLPAAITDLIVDMSSTQIDGHFFGPRDWDYFFEAEIEDCPPLPKNINAILTSPCPFQPGKTIGETHLLMLVPKNWSKDGLLTLRSFKSFCIYIMREKTKNLDSLEFFLGKSVERDTQRINDPKREAEKGSYWMLLAGCLVPGSNKKTEEEQAALIKQYAEKTGYPYRMPSIFQAAVGMVAGLALPDTFPSLGRCVFYRERIRCQGGFCLHGGPGAILGKGEIEDGLYINMDPANRDAPKRYTTAAFRLDGEAPIHPCPKKKIKEVQQTLLPPGKLRAALQGIGAAWKKAFPSG